MCLVVQITIGGQSHIHKLRTGLPLGWVSCTDPEAARRLDDGTPPSLRDGEDPLDKHEVSAKGMNIWNLSHHYPFTINSLYHYHSWTL